MLTKKQKRIKKIINYLKEYINTYENKAGYLNYTDETIINDMIYGLGLAFSSKKYQYRNGFEEFKKYLKNNFF